jgi:hypothetical protein
MTGYEWNFERSASAGCCSKVVVSRVAGDDGTQLQPSVFIIREIPLYVVQIMHATVYRR